MRGLAAITVLVGHYLNPFLVQSGPYAGAGRAVQLARKTPLFGLFAGHEAVILFFVLSGFVLSLKFLRGDPVHYGGFALRRIFRLYVPYLGALALALVCCHLVYRGRIAELSDWFNAPWSGGVTSASVGEHLLFLGSFKSDRYDPVLWSLVHELRISFVFPLIAAFLMKRSWRTCLGIASFLSFAGISARLGCIALKIDGDYCLTVHYVGMFILGFVLAKNLSAIQSWYRHRGLAARLGVGLGGFTLYTFSHELPGPLRYYADVPVALGAGLLVITGLCSLRTSAVLKRPIVKFFGDVSYSLYLYHAIVLLAFVHAFYGALPMIVILALAGLTSMLIAWLSYEFVERPAIKAGKALASRLEGTWGAKGTWKQEAQTA